MNTSSSNEINIAIDTSQTQIDNYGQSLGDSFSLHNTESVVIETVKKIKVYKPNRVVIEVTGRIDMVLSTETYKAKLPVSACNAGQVLSIDNIALHP